MKKKKLKQTIQTLIATNIVRAENLKKLRQDLLITRNMLDLSETHLLSAERALETELQQAGKHSAVIMRHLIEQA